MPSKESREEVRHVQMARSYGWGGVFLPADDLCLAESQSRPGIGGDWRRRRDRPSHGNFIPEGDGNQVPVRAYRGNGPAMQDLRGGQIDVMIGPSSNLLPERK